MSPCRVCDDKGDFSDYNSSWMMLLKLSKVKERKSKGCKTCALFLDGFSAFGLRYIKPKTAVWVQAEEDEKWRHISFQVDGKTRYDEDSKLPCFDLDFFSSAPIGSPKLLPSIDTASRISVDPLSESCSRIIKSWIEECAKDHALCLAPKSAHLPKRVIDIGSLDGTSAPRLYESQGEAGEYAALSYCWGRTPAFTTTAATLASRLQGISWNELPKTLQDAIKLARCLGLQYIWIDSLCIVQDDGKDWEEQASQMASIYEAAYITIAATQSAATTQGFLSNRDLDHELVHQISKKERVSTFVRPKIDHSWLESQYLTEHQFERPGMEIAAKFQYPLFDRAWCFQERILSTRVLYVTDQEYFFQCRCGSRCECCRMGGADTGAGEAKDAYIAILTDSSPSSIKISNAYGKQFQLWEYIVADYTSKNLTFFKDRLPALSGIASRMPKEIMGEYVAGLWRTGLLYGLLWERHYLSDSLRPTTYTGPTFSWVSITGSVRWNQEIHPFHTLRATILEAHCVPKSLDSFGEVTSGFLRLKGLLTTASFAQYCKGETSSKKSSALYKDGKMTYLTCDLKADEHLANCDILQDPIYDDSGSCPSTFGFAPGTLFMTSEPTVLYCFQLLVNPYGNPGPSSVDWFKEKTYRDFNATSLVLRKFGEGEGMFKRMGIATVPCSWFDDKEEMEVTIV